MTELSVLGRTALTYAIRYDWHVFPVAPKRKEPPLINDWPNRATADPDTIAQWWKDWPNANVGIATGASGLVVIDIDAGNGGEATWAALCQRHGIDDDDALISLTGGGGRHLVYRSPNGAKIHNSAGKLGPGLDVRADGGYILAPRSVHPNGTAYTWEVSAHPEDHSLVPLPARL